ncbi:transcriptional regulator, TetR family [Beutenbergia cavernae DSM 12333]|uniref:Transcriptional regulator, TetR family n=1 Tax=Beutenbergia cavernae (strain ATCC BAA-8 / DSM 12333 / CCUG 43141 / JCM 11478 / NBRC 16432 / NCIMB 13614 / HKI 0122) TaxID=471853 RepID=C5C4I8_BEUC1|nr:TetR/AcrR family transcriptional regulator [Beutenbergia cavernae]ACQ82112.1 transcriptional regulator, TetR family [Beutenbergia cavernae DSM 12333]
MPKIIGSSLAEHREQVRHRLFTALSTLMETSGFDAISLADIAARAGVGRTAVYNHFPDKESVLLGFIEHETGAYVAALERALADVDDPVDQLRVYVLQQIQLKRVYHLAPGPDLRTVVSRATMERLRDHIDQVEQMLRRILVLGIATGRLPRQDLDAVVPLVNSCLAGRPVPDSGPARDRAIEATVGFVMRAVGVDPVTVDERQLTGV